MQWWTWKSSENDWRNVKSHKPCKTVGANLFWASANFRPFYALCILCNLMYLTPIQVAYISILGAFTRFLVLFCTRRWSRYSHFLHVWSIFPSSTLHICKRRTCRFPSRGRECWRAPKAQSSASGSSLQRCGFWEGVLNFRFWTFVLRYKCEFDIILSGLKIW